jgi:copper homeostasis protein (lipoprotein)
MTSEVDGHGYSPGSPRALYAILIALEREFRTSGEAALSVMIRVMRKVTIVMLVAMLGACDKDDGDTGDAPVVDLAALPGVYAGTLPCGNCPGIAVRLWLRDDGVFFMRQDYMATVDSPTERVHALGHWTWDAAAALVLRGRGPERRFSYQAPRLEMHTLSGERPILERDTEEPFTDSLSLQGEYISTGDAATFAECLTGLRFRVHEDARGRDLRRRHRSVSPADRAALVSIDAHIAPPGAAPGEVLIVDNFVALRPGTDCSD